MEENFFNAMEELKRVDHLIYVSLKYTRTGDVVKNIISRLADSYEFMTIALLEKLKKEKKIFDVPDFPAEQIRLVIEHYKDKVQLQKDKNLVNDPYFYERQKQLEQDINEIDSGKTQMINNEDFWDDIDTFTQSLQK
jgi:hypothetical protein